MYELWVVTKYVFYIIRVREFFQGQRKQARVQASGTRSLVM